MKQSSHGSEVEQMLRDAGWHPNRRVHDAVERWRAAMAPEGFRLHPAAEAVLLEFGGLHVGRVGAGANQARSDVQLDPELATGEADRFGALPELAGRAVFPLGEVHHGHAFLGIAETGEVYALMDQVYGRWPSFGDALAALLLGIHQADGQRVVAAAGAAHASWRCARRGHRPEPSPYHARGLGAPQLNVDVT